MRRALLTSAIVIVLAATYAGIRLQHVGRHSDKLWLHRCNAIEKYDENRTLYPNVETDIVYRGNGLFDITHDADTTFNLSLHTFLRHLSRLYPEHNTPRIWLDVKNLNAENAHHMLAELSSLIAQHGFSKAHFIIESPDDSSLAAFTKAGYYTSRYVDYDKPSRLSAAQRRQALGHLQVVAASGRVRALSCPVWWYDEIREILPADIDLLTWAHRTTQSEFMLFPPYYRMLHDERLKVILLKKKGRYHR